MSTPQSSDPAPAELDYDVVVIGAGIAGITSGYRLQTQCPNRSYTILESRDGMGGTWDLFKYPGVRSDSDMNNYGFPWKPWTKPTGIAPAKDILAYLKESAAEFDIDKKIQYQHRVEAAHWSSNSKSWSITVDHIGHKKTINCRWVIFSTGYYDYVTPHTGKIPGIENFQGKVIHPQFWPVEYDYAGKDIVIIGSGATAVTLLPNLALKASRVTMLQRTPTYVMPIPEIDPVDKMLRKFLPVSLACRILQLKWIVVSMLFLRFCYAFPNASRRMIQEKIAKELPEDVPVDPHFNPPYNPWEQRLCPSSDFFPPFKSKKASIVTGEIESITSDSIRLQGSDIILKPDVIVTATGFHIKVLGGTEITVDEETVNIGEKHLWNGTLMEGIPNAAIIAGFTLPSWTLGADANAYLTAKIMRHMDVKKSTVVVPTSSRELKNKPVLNMQSGYLTRAEHALPKAGDQGPWKPRIDYLDDYWMTTFGDLSDDLIYG